MSAPTPDLVTALAHASTAQREGRADEAERLLVEVLGELDRGPNPVTGEETARLRARIGQLRIRLGDLRGALRVLYDALEWADDGYAGLHLGRALLLQGAFEEADGHLGRANNRARSDRDGPLAIACWCAIGDLRAARGGGAPAIEAFGKALGISEFAPGDAPSVTPLAGLAEAHLRWRNPGKAEGLARRAVERAERVGDPALRARALLALGVALDDPDTLDEGARHAEAAPHRPLQAHLWVARLRLQDDPALRARAEALLRETGMTALEARLAAPPDATP